MTEFKPRFQHDHVNATVTLSQEVVEYEVSGTRFEVQGTVEQVFLPRPAVTISWDQPEGVPGYAGAMLHGQWDGSIRLPQRAVTIKDCSVNARGDRIRCKPRVSIIDAFPRSKHMSRLLVHVYNFLDISEAVQLDSGEWTAEIRQLDSTRDVIEKVKSTGGYGLTHMLQIARRDGTLFSSDVADDYVSAVHRFISFACGQWSCMGCMSGYDGQADLVWETWGMLRGQPLIPTGGIRWFDELYPSTLQEVWPGFLLKWNETHWRSILQSVTGWYFSANSQGGDIDLQARMVLAQAALEHLAWEYCVFERRLVSANAFEMRRLDAANKIRLLISSLNIPLDVPDCLSAFNGRPGKKWEDVAEIITNLRNAAVHPNPKEQFPHEAWIEGWKLCMWVLDLILLRLFGFNGNYWNRLKAGWAGQVEPVPW